MKNLGRSLGLTACLALSLNLINCMSDNTATGISQNQDKPGMNTSEPTKPNYRNPASSPEFQRFVDIKTQENRDAIIKNATSNKRFTPLEKSSTTYTIGLLVGWSPSSNDAIIYMDDEDYLNGSALSYRNNFSGTFGPVASSNGERMIYGSVGSFSGITQPTANGNIATGTKFRIKSFTVTGALPSARVDYAVFNMGGTCPPNSYSFGRYFHNESTNGQNLSWSSDDIGYQWIQAYYSAANLQFCFVPKSTSANDPLWFQSGYRTNGVFANAWTEPINPSNNYAWFCNHNHGVVLTDDEDDFNGNQWMFDIGMPSSYIPRIEAFMSGGENTQLFFTWCNDIPVGIKKTTE